MVGRARLVQRWRRRPAIKYVLETGFDLVAIGQVALTSRPVGADDLVVEIAEVRIRPGERVGDRVEEPEPTAGQARPLQDRVRPGTHVGFIVDKADDVEHRSMRIGFDHMQAALGLSTRQASANAAPWASAGT